MNTKKILVVLTNVSQYKNDEEKTGLWLAEATEFVDEVTKAGFEVDYVSPKGGSVPIDPRSLKSIYVSKEDLQLSESADFKERALLYSLKPEDVQPEDYIAIYYTGGHGVIWDFPNNTALQEIAYSIYEQGGFISSVCHGVAGLLNIRDRDGRYLIAGKKITGFTKWEEILSGKLKKVPFITETEVNKRGADFQKKLPYTSFALQDGRFVTGQNPMSGRAVAKRLLSNF
ncbi:type 1 glutamine amidotransferase domain-containing protein [Streptococcus plurextorum]|uniref:type 1 glutamine amidotransferase domain-containing protein n=1 Tax=Streptococcus plurextorum TaxID=456876 RepID=UPI0003F6DE90|nr:type 1 glutamine amidotransferase domain-containing protein [Streptococcus plurextorum]